MGITHVTVSVSNLPKDQPPYEADFMVYTGAIDCLAPTSVLKAAGIEIEGRDAYELANGDVVEYPFGFARVSFMGSETVAQIIFFSRDVTEGVNRCGHKPLLPRAASSRWKFLMPF